MSERFKSMWLEGVDFNDEWTGWRFIPLVSDPHPACRKKPFRDFR